VGQLDIGSVFRFHEELSDQIDGITKEFDIDSKYKFGTTRVFYNGQEQRLGVNYLEVDENTIEFCVFAPRAGKALWIHYERII